MTTASHTMIARVTGHDDQRRGITIMAIGAIVIVLSLAASMLWPPRALQDTTHDVQ